VSGIFVHHRGTETRRNKNSKPESTEAAEVTEARLSRMDGLLAGGYFGGSWVFGVAGDLRKKA
jgi:hypothetical protein